MGVSAKLARKGDLENSRWRQFMSYFTRDVTQRAAKLKLTSIRQKIAEYGISLQAAINGYEQHLAGRTNRLPNPQGVANQIAAKLAALDRLAQRINDQCANISANNVRLRASMITQEKVVQKSDIKLDSQFTQALALPLSNMLDSLNELWQVGSDLSDLDIRGNKLYGRTPLEQMSGVWQILYRRFFQSENEVAGQIRLDEIGGTIEEIEQYGDKLRPLQQALPKFRNAVSRAQADLKEIASEDASIYWQRKRLNEAGFLEDVFNLLTGKRGELNRMTNERDRHYRNVQQHLRTSIKELGTAADSVLKFTEELRALFAHLERPLDKRRTLLLRTKDALSNNVESLAMQQVRREIAEANTISRQIRRISTGT